MKSLQAEIKQSITTRILISLGVVVFVVTLISVYELSRALNEVGITLKSELDQVQDFVISQALVNNEEAIALKLKSYEDFHQGRKIDWNPSEVLTDQTRGVTYKFPFGWNYVQPVEKISHSFGTLRVAGSFAEFRGLISEFTVRISLIVVLSLTLLILLLPLTKKIPNRLILKPLKEILALLKGQSEPSSRDDYLEIHSIKNEVREFLVEKEKLIHRERNIEKKLIAVQTSQTLAHEVRRPFVKLKRTLDAMESIHDKEEMQKFVSEAVPDIKRALSSVSRKLSELTELGNPKPMQINAVPLASILDSALDEAEGMHPDKVFDTEIQLNGEILNVDYEKTHRVFSNVLENAIKAVPPNGKIWIKTIKNDKPCITVCIGNSGSYIEQSERQRIFNLFEKGKSSSGSGIGLAVAKMYVEDHGGKICCESVANKGTEFFIQLPAKHLLNQEMPNENFSSPI